MARLALVSRNPVMSMGLSATAHEIVEVRPSALEEWLQEGNDADVDALVLDLGTPGEALRVVGDLRARGRWTPALVVAGSSTGWDSPELAGLPGVDLLTLPIDSARLQRAADSVLRHPRTPPAMLPIPNPPEQPAPLIEDFEDPDNIPEPVLLAGSLDDTTAQPIAVTEPTIQARPPSITSEPVEELIPPVEDQPDLRPEPSQAPPKPESPSTPTPIPKLTPPVSSPPQRSTPIPVREVEVEEAPAAPPKVSRKQRKRTSQSEERPGLITPDKSKPKKRGKSEDRPSSTGTEVTVADLSPPGKSVSTPRSHPRRRSTDRLPDQGPGAVVAALLEAANVLYTLAETAEVIVEDAIERADANSGALLVPDGTVWRVSAGVGLRPIEYRYQLTDESWLIERVGESHRGLLIENSDVARQALHGAPLASRTHLLAVPVPDVAAVLLLSRDEDPPFSELDLAKLAQLAREAGPLLQRAIDLRALSRALARHFDSEEALHEHDNG